VIGGSEHLEEIKYDFAKASSKEGILIPEFPPAESAPDLPTL